MRRSCPGPASRRRTGALTVWAAPGGPLPWADRATGPGIDLHEIAELPGEPEPAPGAVTRGGRKAVS